MQGAAGQVMQDIFSIESALAKIAALENPAGYHEVKITITMPEGWIEKLEAAFDKFTKSFEDEN
jgi:hypothetical protein